MNITIKYSDNIYIFAYGHGGESEKPIIDGINLEDNLKFYSDDLNLLIDNEGIIKFNKKSDYGIYNSIIYLQINDSIYNTKIKYCIYPIVNYNFEKLNIEYSNYYETNNPIISNNINLEFFIKKQNGIRIDQSTGKLYFNEEYMLPVDNYNIIITYKYTEVLISINLIVNIVPIIKYENIINTLSDTDIFISDKPFINPSNGSFKLNNDIFMIDEEGIIKSNKLDIGNYKLKIQYIYNNIINEIDYQVINNPIISYKENSYTMNYQETGFSEVPEVYPEGGIFKIKNNSVGITIDNNGKIIFGNNINIGKYNIIVIYQYNTNIISYNYNLTVKPNIIFNDDIFIYNNIIKTNKPSNFNNGKFELINYNFHMNPNTGEITLLNPDPANYSFEIKYTENNVSINTIYNVCIKPKLEFDDYNLKIKYKTNEIIRPLIFPINGKFYINNKESNDGFIYTKDLEVGIYNYLIDYVYNNVKSSKNILLTIESNIYYAPQEFFYKEIFYWKPNRIIGKFSCDGLEINKNGIITIQNLEIGKYNYIVKNELNNIITDLNVSFEIVPKFYYSENNINIIYGNEYNSLEPYFNVGDNLYVFLLQDDYDFITINQKTGIINFDKNLKLGSYNIIVNLIVKDIIREFLLKINVLPNVSYKNNIYTFNYNEKIYIPKPIINPNKGFFCCTNLPNKLLLNEDGSIISNAYLETGEFILDIKYILNESFNNNLLTIIIKPIIEYNEEYSEIIYGNYFESKIPKINADKKGIFTIDKPHRIDEDGKFIIDSSLVVGDYNIAINYEINNIIEKKIYQIKVNPDIKIEQNYFEFEYLDEYIIKGPYVNPIGGYFILDENVEGITINENTGEIYIISCLVNRYNLKLYYYYNGNYNNVTYTILIKPNIKYFIKSKQIIYNSNFNATPILEPPFGKIRTAYFLNKYGEINFNKFDIGNHIIEVIYEYNNILNSFIYEFEIIPKFIYNNLLYEIFYNDNFLSDIPICEPKGLILNSSDLNILENGQINFSSYEVGYHEININYGNSNQIIKLIVKPVFSYEKNIEMNYNDPIILHPNIINEGGLFKCKYDIDPNTGILNLENLYPVNETITISYLLNNIISYNLINILCKPKLIYNINESTINFSINGTSEIPIIEPKGGQIYCNNLCSGVSLEENGLLIFNNPNVGNYIFDIEYKYNNISVKTSYYLIVYPLIYYESNSIFYYGFNNEGLIPIVKPNNGVFTCDEFNISNIGQIILDEKTEIGKYSPTIYYKVNNLLFKTNYNFEIVPFLFYNNTKLIYGINKIIPIINPIGGTFKISNNDSCLINDNGEIIINNMEPGKYIFNIEYSYKNNTYLTKCNLLIKPSINFDKKFICYPENGELEILNNRYLTDNILENIGNHNLIINYKYNNIISRLKMNISFELTKLYSKDIYEFYYNEPISIIPKVNIGDFILENNIIDIILTKNGTIKSNKINVGKYNLKIKYSINNFEKTYDIILIIKPKIKYSDIVCYGYSKIRPIFYNPIDGIFQSNFKYRNIKLCANGDIIVANIIPNIYKIDLDYIVNGINENVKFDIIVKPNINFNLDDIIIKYDEEYINNEFSVFPKGGTFEVNYSDVKVDYDYFKIEKGKTVDNYNIIIKYIVNNQFNKITKRVIIEPIFYYEKDNIKITYYDKLNSVKPIVNPSGGKFILNNNENNKFFINETTGIIYGENIELGKYELTIKYTYNNISSYAVFKVECEPIFYYNHGMTINYVNEFNIISDIPIYYPENGKFILDHELIKIEENTGKIHFTNLDVGNYDLNILYLVENYKLYTKFKFIVNAIINYNINNASILYNNSFKSEEPEIIPKGGTFFSTNLPDGCFIDKFTGIITIYKLNDTIKFKNSKILINNVAQIGNYELNISYNYNNQISSTIYYLTIR